MAEATSRGGVESFGVAYGLYNMAWGAGLLGGPATGGFAYERIGFGLLTLIWAVGLIAVTALLVWSAAHSRPAVSRPAASTGV